MSTLRTLALALLLSPALVAQDTRPALNGLDPVALTRGEEVAGQADAFLEHDAYRYVFASPENQKTFRDAPERFAIQMGGGCGRMGPRSGKGSPDRFWVHDGRIYIFASEQCRQAFQKAPALFLDPDDAPASGTEDAAQRGRALLALAVDAFGGNQRVDGVKSLIQHAAWTDASGNKKVERLRTWTLRFPDCVRCDESWDDWQQTEVDAPDAAFVHYTSARGPQECHATARRELLRELHRWPLLMLRARERSDFRAFAAGSSELDGTPLEDVTVSFDGTTTTLGIDPESGRILRVAYRGRGPRMSFGRVVLFLGDYRQVGGLRLPFTSKLEFDGRAVDGSNRTLASVVVDQEVLDARFARPEK